MTTRPPASIAGGSREWSKKVGWEALLNRAGTTFRKLPDADKQGLDEKKAIALMLAQPSLIKRPVLELGGGKLLVGFKPETIAKPSPAISKKHAETIEPRLPGSARRLD